MLEKKEKASLFQPREMGKAAITKQKTAANSAQMKTKKKKGRPSFADLQQRQLKSLTPSPKLDISTTSRRSSRRRSSGGYNSVSSEFISDDFEDDDEDDDEREEKKVKLVVRLPESAQLHSLNSSSQNSGSASDSEPEEAEDHDASLNGGTINADESRSNDDVIDQEKQDLKGTVSLHGSPPEGGPPTPLPEKKLLLFILDRLQKKDTHGVFAEPVDPDELPDYHEIVEHPMDFGTVRKKLDKRGYSNLEELEADVYLICSNAMLYNATHTVYHRQARSIAELAKRDFANLRNGGDDGEPKVVRRGRPPGKNIKKHTENSTADRTEPKNVKKLIENSPVDRAGTLHSSGATLASGEDTPYNLRKGPAMHRLRNNDGFTANYGSRNGDNYSDWLVDWNSEFPAKILRADMKYGKKDLPVDEYRRDTYKQHQLLASANQQPYLSNTSGDKKQLIAVGLHLDSHGYARSVARYAANLGPVAWKVASKKIKSVLTDGTPFGPGWVGENDAPSQTPFFASCEKLKPVNGFIDDHHDSSKKPVPTVPCLSSNKIASIPLEEMADPVTTPLESEAIQSQQKSVFHHGMNGYNGIVPRHDVSSQTGIISRIATAVEQGSTSYQTPSVLPKSDVSPIIINSKAHQALQQRPLSVPPDLNVRISTSGSPTSMKIGSPQQPDLALQL